MKNVLRAVLALVLAGAGGRGYAQSGQKANVSRPSAARVLLRTPDYTVYADSVVQKKEFTSRVLSSTEIVSDYKSPAARYKDARISFKFSINGKDNEMVSGTDHHFTCIGKDGVCVTPLIRFGIQLTEKPSAGPVYLDPDTRLTLRTDLREVFKAFGEQGYFTTFRGDKIYKEDFKGVYVAGSTPPMIWDFDNLVNHPQLQLTDEDGDHIYEATLLLNRAEDRQQPAARWKLSKDVAAFPQYRSPFPVSDALYNLSLEEMCRAVEQDSTFRTGKEWAGVWTRDVSYSIILSMAYMQPAVAMKSLLRKVNGKGRIIQDTGTGGAYPCSTDRMIWAAAAWEIYLATGDEGWLKTAYEVIKRSMEDDDHVAYDRVTGLVMGESSFLDWREQTYPRWMQPADIFQSECLGTNAVHFRANEVLSKMAHLLKDEATAQKRAAVAEQIRRGINRYLWLPEKGYYAQYLYGRNNLIVSPRWEALGEALCILWDIAGADRSKEIIRRAPMTAFGIPCIYPQIPDIPPYHNNAIWPFVESFWTLAAARAGDERAVMKGIGDIYRPAALFLTNKENFEADNGDYAGTQINSSNMLWSLSGSISLVHKVLFGLRLTDSGLAFQPFVPRTMGGIRKLSGFGYRGAVLDIELEGYGNRMADIRLDGKTMTGRVIPTGLTGRHNVYIRMTEGVVSGAASGQATGISSTLRPVRFSLPTPEVHVEKGELVWHAVKGAARFKVLKNGQPAAVVRSTRMRAPGGGALVEYQVIAIDTAGVESFASEPLMTGEEKYSLLYQAEDIASRASYDYKGFTGEGFIEVSGGTNRVVRFPVDVTDDGAYVIDVRYANGNGPTNTENKCAIRTMAVDDRVEGTIVLPQRGKGEWSNWGYSNPVKIRLGKGRHVIELRLEDFDDNMNGDINQAMIDCLRVRKVAGR
ncbi:MAG: glycogen debranching protein [Sphingobacteriales bacterium 50-39]|nr:glycogen debranching protein [Sphingobacteriales bacterium]OJW56039.1 MAG: glycogen debranching protein [Sphingobacteriales bacterium 50-39]